MGKLIMAVYRMPSRLCLAHPSSLLILGLSLCGTPPPHSDGDLDMVLGHKRDRNYPLRWYRNTGVLGKPVLNTTTTTPR